MPAARPPKAAATVNEHDVLLSRARECGEARDRHPNIVAVDFYAMGNVFDVVRELTYTGRIFDGREAQQLGFVTRVVEDPRAALTDALTLALCR